MPLFRNIKGFVIQGGDPTGTGKGGESAWGGYLKEEFHPELKVGQLRGMFARRVCHIEACQHDERGVVAMANKGSSTVGSQFYITYAKAPHLNNVSPVIGRCVSWCMNAWRACWMNGLQGHSWYGCIRCNGARARRKEAPSRSPHFSQKNHDSCKPSCKVIATKTVQCSDNYVFGRCVYTKL